MNNISRKTLELKSILAIFLPTIFLGLAVNLPNNIFYGLVMLFLLATLVGLSVPEIVVTWLILISTVLGISLLTLGYVAMSMYGKILLLVAFPLETYLVSQLKQSIFNWQIYKNNEASAYRHIQHYDPVVKLQTTYNAKKLYKKKMHILTTKNLPLWCDLTVIKWEHALQFTQFNKKEYDDILKQIATILKKSRLVDENLYYLGNGKFLIISGTIAPNTLTVLNDELKDNLKSMTYKDYRPAFKMATQHISKKDVGQYPDLTVALKRLNRKLETDLVVEYLKETEHE